MNTLPAGAVILLGSLPLLGLGVLAVVLLGLGLKKDRWIVPGIIFVILGVAAWGTVMAFGGKVTALTAKAPENENAAAEPSAEEEVPSPPEFPSSPASQSESPPPKKSQPAWVTVKNEPRNVQPLKPPPLPRTSGPTVIYVPQPSSTPNVPAARPEPVRETEKPAPPPAKPKEEPEKRESPPPPVKPPEEPKPTPPTREKPPEQPKTTVAATTKPAEEKKPEPAPSRSRSSNEPGTLVISIRGPIMETSTARAPFPHILVILNGPKSAVDIREPSSVEESHIGNDPSQPVNGYAYTWQNVQITFAGLEPGWYTVMIDTSLGPWQSHRNEMISNQTQNDWNGVVEIRAGESAWVQCGMKPYPSAKLPCSR